LPGLIGIFGEPGPRGKLINVKCYARKHVKTFMVPRVHKNILEITESTDISEIDPPAINWVLILLNI
jgi:hypothetical protein